MRKVYLLVALSLFTGFALTAVPAASAQVAVGISVRIGPPPLRVIAVQPMCPGPGYFWMPGYWAYGSEDYYWVPGEWVMAPSPGMLWTPGYWGWAGDGYRWHAGYWGRRVGFYGGVNYGFGYFGDGFAGGRWEGGRFYYNTAVWRVNRTVIHTTYVDRTVIRNQRVTRVSYNGGPGGIAARPTGAERHYARERYVDARPARMQHENRGRTANDRGAVSHRAHTEHHDGKSQRQGYDHGSPKDDHRGHGRSQR